MCIKKISDLINAIVSYNVNTILSGGFIVKTVFYKGKKLFNLNSIDKSKAVRKLKAIGEDKPIRIKKHKSDKNAGDYNYYDKRLSYATIYID